MTADETYATVLPMRPWIIARLEAGEGLIEIR
jgi:hypothetical protein